MVQRLTDTGLNVDVCLYVYVYQSTMGDIKFLANKFDLSQIQLLYMCMYVCVVCMFVGVWVHTCVRICVCICMHVCVFTSLHTYIVTTKSSYIIKFLNIIGYTFQPLRALLQKLFFPSSYSTAEVTKFPNQGEKRFASVFFMLV